MSTRATLLASAQADGFTGVTSDVANALFLELLKQISGTSMTKAQLIAAAQADGFTGVTDDVQNALFLELLQQILAGGGGGGAVAATGTNYKFTGTSPNQVFKVVNLDTGLANQVDTAGADGSQTIVLQNGT